MDSEFCVLLFSVSSLFLGYSLHVLEIKRKYSATYSLQSFGYSRIIASYHHQVSSFAIVHLTTSFAILYTLKSHSYVFSDTNANTPMAIRNILPLENYSRADKRRYRAIRSGM